MTKIAIIFEAHSDDFAVGGGGTLIKLKKEDYYIIKVIFSAGQKSHPHYKEEVIIKQRIQEKDIRERIRRIIKKSHPRKIFVNSSIDPHQDHRAVNEAVIDVINDLNYGADIYEYEVWNILKDNKPVTYTDITPYFRAKIAMMKAYRSQWIFMYPLIIAVYLRAKFYGFKHECKYAEKFYKIK